MNRLAKRLLIGRRRDRSQASENNKRPTMLSGRGIVWPQPATEAELHPAGESLRGSLKRRLRDLPCRLDWVAIA